MQLKLSRRICLIAVKWLPICTGNALKGYSFHIKRLIQKRKSESRVMAWAVVGSCWHLRSYGASTQVPPPHQQHAPMKKPSLLNTCKRPDPPLGGATRWRGGCNPLIPRIMRTGQHSEGAGSK